MKTEKLMTFLYICVYFIDLIRGIYICTCIYTIFIITVKCDLESRPINEIKEKVGI